MNSPARLTTALSDRYRIERELGEGGMATVYLAEDIKHDRKVAVKVLRPELAAVIGADRFLSEIKTTANLQHPHILPLFDSGAADGFLFYVMPYVQGETVRDRIAREKQLPVADAVRIATEVAGALDHAHRSGVIHRDIKPENILLHDGSALVADFGIALAASKAGGTRMTETGMSLGTPHYMSPEQAMGEREITARSDVYALGCVLYEMLLGEPPFTGPTAQSIVAKVMTEKPAGLIARRERIPPEVEGAILTALEKLPADRFASAAEFAAALTDTRYQSTAMLASSPSAGPGGRVWQRRFMVAAAIACVAVVAAAWGWARVRAAADQPTTWQYISLGDSVAVALTVPALAISPDGSELVIKEDGQNGLLWIKRDGALEPVPIPGTERAQNPVFSPDGEWVAFIANEKLRKVRPSSGAAITLADSAGGGFGGATWLDDGTLVYVTPDFNRMLRIDASGRNPTVVLDTRGMPGGGFSSPTPLPDSRGIIFLSCSSGCVTMSLMALDFKSGEPKLLLSEVAQGWYLPTGDLLYYRRDGTALVAKFDLDKLEVVGAGIPVFENVFFATSSQADLVWSPSGTVVYVTGGNQNNENNVVRITRDGLVAPVDTTWTGQFTALSMSPDGKRMAVGMGVGVGGQNIWIKQLDRGPLTRLSFGGSDRRPVWSADGRMVAFIRDTLGASIVVGRFADGSRPDTVLAHIDRQVQEVDWSPDGKWLVLRTDNGTTGAGDLVGIRTGGDTTEVPLVASPFTELHPAVSPDSRWIAYTSNESGQNEVYVRPFPNTGDSRWQVSTTGGSTPRWAPDGTEIYYVDPSGRMSSARVTTTPTFAVGERQALFGAAGYTLDAFHQAYTLSADGKYFYMASPRRIADLGRAPTLVRVDHWFTDMKARLAQ